MFFQDRECAHQRTRYCDRLLHQVGNAGRVGVGPGLRVQFVGAVPAAGLKRRSRKCLLEAEQGWLAFRLGTAEVGSDPARLGALVAKPQHGVVRLENQRRTRCDQMVQLCGYPARTHSHSGVLDRSGPLGFAFRSCLPPGIGQVAAEKFDAGVDPVMQEARATRLVRAFE